MMCPICSETKLQYLFVIHGLPIARCPGCGLVRASVHPANVSFPTSISPFSEMSQIDERVSDVSSTDIEASKRYLRTLALSGIRGGRLLFIGSEKHPFRALAGDSGFTVDSYDLCSGTPPAFERPYDAAVILHQIQTVEAPDTFLDQIHGALLPGAIVLLTVPLLDSWPARLLGFHWPEWRLDSSFFFDRVKIQALLLRCGFQQITVRSDRRLYTLRHICDRAEHSPRTLLTRAIRFGARFLPAFVHATEVRLSTSSGIVTAARIDKRLRLCCSIVVAAFNEAKSLPVLMDALLAKKLDALDREIIIVESNSTDGTREIVLRYQSHPDVTVVLEDAPRGKGVAVRAGLDRARGDIILIQDADLEYDLNDYDDLLEPLLARRAMFVLGSRHGGDWKMRKFEGQAGLAIVLNVAHIFFTTLINVLYRQRMRDPFTMYKLFYRDCLHGLRFECCRFDFDHELVIKLVRKGYTPVEVPVNYRSRTFKEGKKVRMFRDPLTWLWVDVRLRFSRLYPGRFDE